MSLICYNCFRILSEEGYCPYCGFNNAQGREKYPFALPHGTVLGGKYIVGRVLGQGGFGITYIAQDYTDKKLVAIKEYYPEQLSARLGNKTVSTLSGEKDEAFRYGMECFLSEARTLAEFIGNPNIVRVYSYFEENNTAYFAMEYIEGISLKEYLKNHGGKIGYEEAKQILIPVMNALSAVHAKGIIHRDISPDNIYLTKDGSVKLLDFGSARYSMGDRSRSLDVVLKHGYAPKEQYTRHGRQGAYTDVYSLAATFYRAITGRIPPDSIDRIDEDNLIAPSVLGCRLPNESEDALMKALSVSPQDRYQSVAEFKADLESGKSALPAAKAAVVMPLAAAPLVSEPISQHSVQLEPLFVSQAEVPQSNVLQNTVTQNTAPQDVEPQTAELPAADFDLNVQPAESGKGSSSDEKKKKRWIPLAASAAAIVLVVLTVLFVLQGKDSDQAKVADGNSVSDSDTGKLKPDNADAEPTEAGAQAQTDHSSVEGSQAPSTAPTQAPTQPPTQAATKAPSQPATQAPTQPPVSTADYTYTTNSDGSLTITGYKGSASSITIPSTIAGKKVTGIGEDAFSSNNQLRSVTISNGIQSIDRLSFWHCTSLTSISIPASVKSIGDHAFTGCTSLGSISLPDSITNIGWSAFEHCSALKTATLPKYLTYIDMWLFSDCISLTSVTIPSGVTGIGIYAFERCSSLTSITIPDKVNKISYDAFSYCSSLTSIVIPDSVTEIGYRAFKGCSSLTYASVPSGCKVLDDAFSGCPCDGNLTYR